jgi:hypothetical protein
METGIIQNNTKPKKIRYIIVIVIIIIAGFLFYKFFNTTSYQQVSMDLTSFKEMCLSTQGEYNQGVIFGAGAVPYINCGYKKASDAGRLCKTEKQKNSCFLCTYKASCYLAAGDFGPEHCSCGSYKILKSLSANNITLDDIK